MTNDEVLQLAKDVGAEVLPKTVMYFQNAALFRFAELVASKEREACANMLCGWMESDERGLLNHNLLMDSAAAIRARSNSELKGAAQ